MDLSWFIGRLMAVPGHNSDNLREDSTRSIIASNCRWICKESEPWENSAGHLQPALHMPEPLSITCVRPTIKEVIACDTIEN